MPCPGESSDPPGGSTRTDTALIHIENTTGQPITGLELAHWTDSCAPKAQPPNSVHVVFKKPLQANAQAVVKIPPSKLRHTRNEVSRLVVQGALEPARQKPSSDGLNRF